MPSALRLSGRIEESFQRRLAMLPEQTRRLLVIAAAEPTGDPTLVWRAAARLGIGTDAAAPAVYDGLAEFGARVRFRHPLVRSATYRSAPVHEKQLVHRALADVTNPDSDPDRRAWHRAQAAQGPDEDVAAELERSADRAKARGGLAAAAAFLERATMLTLDPSRRADRALLAASAKVQAGAFDAALELLNMAEVDVAQRFPVCPHRPPPGAARLRYRPRQRCPATADEGRRTAGVDRRRSVTRDLSGRATGRDDCRPISFGRWPFWRLPGRCSGHHSRSPRVSPTLFSTVFRHISPKGMPRVCQFCGVLSASRETDRPT